ncbi:hypothetical protein MOQ72_01045 [Saccharopolyspora sp. K220]|uniref:hypothetical protein n=1 Tax=Saccharopolyspora soli TaxID=2926618 RepID=UPI001F599716|nr:hypothetical protein [Saccharopolyspora soli]MCI2415997.1 hypothetical protein [Saccharopolyspora soli]
MSRFDLPEELPMLLAEYGQLVVQLSDACPAEAELIQQRLVELDAVIDCRVAAIGTLGMSRLQVTPAAGGSGEVGPVASLQIGEEPHHASLSVQHHGQLLRRALGRAVELVGHALQQCGPFGVIVSGRAAPHELAHTHHARLRIPFERHISHAHAPTFPGVLGRVSSEMPAE